MSRDIPEGALLSVTEPKYTAHVDAQSFHGVVLAQQDLFLRCQAGKIGISYAKALAEICNGGKTTHWIWYVWPSLLKIRTTNRPDLQFESFYGARVYLRNDKLCFRLHEITTVATRQLKSGVKKEVLFGSKMDAAKFFEVSTCFTIASIWENDKADDIFLNALEAIGGGTLHEGTLDLARVEGFSDDQETKLRISLKNWHRM